MIPLKKFPLECCGEKLKGYNLIGGFWICNMLNQMSVEHSAVRFPPFSGLMCVIGK